MLYGETAWQNCYRFPAFLQPEDPDNNDEQCPQGKLHLQSDGVFILNPARNFQGAYFNRLAQHKGPLSKEEVILKKAELP